MHLISQLSSAFFVFLLYDITSKQTYQWVDDCYHNIILRSLPPNSYIYLIGNKSDLITKREVPYNNAKVYAKANSMFFIEISCMPEVMKNLELVVKILKMKASNMSINMLYKSDPKILAPTHTTQVSSMHNDSSALNELNVYDSIGNIEDKLVSEVSQAPSDNTIYSQVPTKIDNDINLPLQKPAYDTLQDMVSKPYSSGTHIKDFSLQSQSVEHETIKVVQPALLSAPYEITKDPTPQFQTQSNDKNDSPIELNDASNEMKNMNLCQPYKYPFTYSQKQYDLESDKQILTQSQDLKKEQRFKNEDFEKINSQIIELEKTIYADDFNAISSRKGTARLKKADNLPLARANNNVEVKKTNKTPVIKAVVATNKPKEIRLSIKDKIKKKEEATLFYLKVQYKLNSFIELEINQSDSPSSVAMKCLNYLGVKSPSKASQLGKIIESKANEAISEYFGSNRQNVVDNRGKQIINLSVMISKENVIPILIYERDEPAKLAIKIAKDYKLNPEKEAMLKNSIANSIEEYRKRHSAKEEVPAESESKYKSAKEKPTKNLSRIGYGEGKDNISYSPKGDLRSKSTLQKYKEKSTVLTKTYRDKTPTKRAMPTDRNKSLLFNMNFNLNDGKLAKIVVREGDDLHYLAERFSISNKLGNASIEKVYGVLRKTYNEHIAKIGNSMY